MTFMGLLDNLPPPKTSIPYVQILGHSRFHDRDTRYFQRKVFPVPNIDMMCGSVCMKRRRRSSDLASATGAYDCYCIALGFLTNVGASVCIRMGTNQRLDFLRSEYHVAMIESYIGRLHGWLRSFPLHQQLGLRIGAFTKVSLLCTYRWVDFDLEMIRRASWSWMFEISEGNGKGYCIKYS